jgi:hypothetical protein
MKAEYTGGDPFGEGLAQDGDLAREDLWNEQLHPRHFKENVRTYLSVMDSLVAKSTGRRPPEIAERKFVEHLAQYWTQTLGLAVLNGRGPGEQGKQQGAFADFVRAVADLYWKIVLELPDGSRYKLKIGSLEGHIRAVADQIRKKRPQKTPKRA